MTVLTKYRLKFSEIDAVMIDAAWSEFLLKERGFATAPIGSYYFTGIDGTEIVWPPHRFEKLFEPV